MWTHSICVECWNKNNPDRQAHKVLEGNEEDRKCCFCGNIHSSGIYVRKNPAEVLCKGQHD